MTYSNKLLLLGFADVTYSRDSVFKLKPFIQFDILDLVKSGGSGQFGQNGGSALGCDGIPEKLVYRLLGVTGYPFGKPELLYRRVAKCVQSC